MPSVPNRTLMFALFRLLRQGYHLGVIRRVGRRRLRADLRRDRHRDLGRVWIDHVDQWGVGHDAYVLYERLGAAGHDNPFRRDVSEVSHERGWPCDERMIGAH